MANPELPVPDGLVLRPFHGVRFTAGEPGGVHGAEETAKVTSPPYDLISDDDVRELLAIHPNNVVRLILPGSDRHHYAQARDTLRDWLRSGVLAADPDPAVYVYEQSAGDRVLQRGLIGAVALADPGTGVILPHEHVMPGPVADRLALMRTTESNLEPIFLVYEGGGPATRLVDEIAASRTPLVQADTTDGLRHRLWTITDPAELAVLDDDLRPRQALIADGHHRYATYRALQAERRTEAQDPAAASGPWDYGLVLLVDSSAYPPDLHPIHRVIPGLPLGQAVSKAKGACQVHEYGDLAEGMAALAEVGDPAYLLAGEGDACHLLTKPDPLQLAHAMPHGASPRWSALNTSILAEFLLPKVWGRQDDEHTVRIVHHDPHAAVRQARETDGTAVILNPLALSEVLALAAGGERVPRKSTSFGPKPRTGLVMRTFATG
ncbi:DUF1015 domain-containing protein [Spongiactinospora sp. TRM90649]|uniref:DUF1015 domain-containing protein n=1 Tax=Spongiactinospora sp. TRM90649 TaxID=3031114 RepID=UPI0023F8988C|nr:DUF1015 domain-containing protein [Spongiactinospora sp. TRM90649]MDF5759234.1 DUF1015 domain-containing protein [Spongiactinospora sp. TRM90649]